MRLGRYPVVLGATFVSTMYVSFSLLWWHQCDTGELGISVKEFWEPDHRIINQTIYFLETSGKSYLSHRQLASVESVTRFVSHSKILVLIFSTGDITFTKAMRKLSHKLNVQFVKAEILSTLRGTPLEEWYKFGLVQNSEHVVVHTSDALRLALLWKYGGIYMDLDIIMFKKYRVTKSTVYWEANMKYLGNCMMAFDKGHSLLKMYMEEFSGKYNPETYAGNGPWLLTDVFVNYKKAIEDKGSHYDVDEVHPHFFSSLNFNETYLYFDEYSSKRALRSRTKHTFGHHIWNFKTKNILVSPNSHCAYIQIVRRNSPIVYQEMLKSRFV